MADGITRFTGSMLFVYIHLAVFGFWIVANLHWVPGVPAWDESFVILAMVASVEAIFLSTFVLITQNRMAAAADKRAGLDLQTRVPFFAELNASDIADIMRLLRAQQIEAGGTPICLDMSESRVAIFVSSRSVSSIALCDLV